MINTVIIEDERPARENLLQSLRKISGEINVIATLVTVKESIDFLRTREDADIIFCDVQLPDGLSFGIFREAKVEVPVIFITGFDEFMMNAFEYNGIDYLLKPVDEKELGAALQKYKMLENHFSGKSRRVNGLVNYIDGKRKTRLVVRKGLENIALPLDNIVLFYTENKVVFVIDRNGKKYLSDKNLGELEEELDANRFFRANRQYIINIDYIKGFKAFEKVKLQVDVSAAEISQSIIISQETAAAFRKWVGEA